MRKLDALGCRGFLLLSTVCCLLLALPGYGQKREDIDSIDPGRPDQTNGTSVVQKHFVQLEGGLRYQEGRSSRTYNYPTLTVRYGLLDRVELRLGTGFEASVPSSSRQRQRGVGAPEVGTRVYLWDEKGVLPQAAFTATATLPVGKKELRPTSPEARMRLGLSNSLTDDLTLTYTYGYGWVQNATEQKYAVKLAARLSKQFSVYGEAFGTTETRSRPDNEVDMGLLWLVRPNLQLDIAGGAGISSAAPAYFITTGASIRLPY
ncbi:transporter [Hymenobacter aerilatus]|uniref:Transporter n=1 Tax=Hymenobacter aerilatus TaxID=2932251 RepID=A0A8T9STN1_9BACT|nr:transporter [Hymenobacter aerilatus]UOR05097.1 transporter [Hymenobacter aerilatus]